MKQVDLVEETQPGAVFTARTGDPGNQGTGHPTDSRGPDHPYDYTLSPDVILNAEYEYAIQTCLQAHEDRARVASYYLVGVGSLIVAILGAQVDMLQNAPFYGAFGALFLVLSLYGVVTLLQLVRLREAWIDSAAALCQIKEYYIKRCKEMNLDAAFRWRAATLPRTYRPWSVSFLLAVQVALLGGATFGAAVVCVGMALGLRLYVIGMVCGFFTAVINVALYRLLLRGPKGPAARVVDSKAAAT